MQQAILEMRRWKRSQTLQHCVLLQLLVSLARLQARLRAGLAETVAVHHAVRSLLQMWTNETDRRSRSTCLAAIRARNCGSSAPRHTNQCLIAAIARCAMNQFRAIKSLLVSAFSAAHAASTTGLLVLLRATFYNRVTSARSMLCFLTW